MSFSFSSLIRLIVFLAIASTMAAVGIARLDPARPNWRHQMPSTFSNVNEYFLEVTDRTPRWLDAETGRVAAYPLSDGDVLETASCAPWANEKGETQVVGRWSSRTKNGPMSMSSDFGLARYTFPAGELLDHVSTEIVPVSPPCWFPGTRARVLFPAGDGQLYHFAFESDAVAGGLQEPVRSADGHPSPIAWRCQQPGVGNVFVGEAVWPEGPKMRDCLIVTLRQQVRSVAGRKAYSRTQLWWVKLNPAGTEIVEADRLIVPDATGSYPDDVDERSPSVTTRPDGRLMLAYLNQAQGQKGWDLCVTPLAIDAERRAPLAFASSTKILGGGCQPARPSFSPDCRWVNMIVGTSTLDGRVVRRPTGGL